MVSRLHAKTNQIGKILHNLEKYNHLMKDGENIRSPTTPSSVSKSILNKTSPTSPRGEKLTRLSSSDNVTTTVHQQNSSTNQQQSPNSQHQSANTQQLSSSNGQQCNNQQQSADNQQDSSSNNEQMEVNSQLPNANNKENTLQENKSNNEISLNALTQEKANA